MNPAQSLSFRLSLFSMSFSLRGSAILLLVPLVLASPEHLVSQVSLTGRLGATYTTTMVSDQIAGSPVDLAPGISPTLGVEVAYPLRTRTPLEASGELQVALGTLERKEGGARTDVSSLQTIALTAGIAGRVGTLLRLRAGVGLMSYAFSEKAGVFQQGRPLRPLGTAALEYRRPLTPTLRLSAQLRYDLHSFTTKQLEANGYTGSQTVHRVTVGIGVSG